MLIWFLRKKTATMSRLIVFDAFTGKQLLARGQGRIVSVCADLHTLPFKIRDCRRTFFISIPWDMWAIVERRSDEFFARLQTVHLALFLIHSECGDYRSRWPDKALIARLRKDCSPTMTGTYVAPIWPMNYTRWFSAGFRYYHLSNPGVFWIFLGYPENTGWPLWRPMA